MPRRSLLQDNSEIVELLVAAGMSANIRARQHEDPMITRAFRRPVYNEPSLCRGCGKTTAERGFNSLLILSKEMVGSQRERIGRTIVCCKRIWIQRRRVY